MFLLITSCVLAKVAFMLNSQILFLYNIRSSTRDSTSLVLSKCLATILSASQSKRTHVPPNYSLSTKRLEISLILFTFELSLLWRHHVHVWRSCTSVKTLLLYLQTAYAIPILAFAFVCHPEVLPIYTELSK